MKMDREQDSFKRRLDEELGELHFTREMEVLERTHPATWQARLKSIWNKEIEVPLLPVCAAFLLLFATVVIYGSLNFGSPAGRHSVDREQRHLIVAGGSTYWKEDFEKAVAAHEN
ncbi:hypothetical protein KZ483_02360 [Paenibacillus sp. sptzw28]|uniref:hypothetical protein n=1 Tax=Paenibacillus sp. sptzw28 TaxID=715179 RepID=UPI001C6E8086|nr:hypothetical protein [Paenibacillus sp. sptzw28]QYR21902.1 hypothetical protein KZ483_02360 [Paenibacillus sp. sptzw28]